VAADEDVLQGRLVQDAVGRQHERLQRARRGGARPGPVGRGGGPPAGREGGGWVGQEESTPDIRAVYMGMCWQE
jgi:hypothetical protein